MTTICDSHVHIVGPQDRYPWAANRTFTAPPATLDQLVSVANPLGVGRFVVVQPSFYGTDNRATLDAVAALGPAGRGVAVIDPTAIDAASLQDMQARGIRGLRINLYSTMATGMPSLEQAFLPLRDVAARMGWHVQVIAPGRVLAGAAAMLGDAGITVVIDHYGLPGAAPGSEQGRALLGLMRRPDVWVKLSGPYRFMADPMEIAPPPDWLAALLDVAGERAVWGSDWPHTPVHELAHGETPPQLGYRTLSYAGLLARFTQAVSPGVADAVLRTNPARLYGFA